MKTLLGCLQSFSIHHGLATLPAFRSQECSFLAQDWALFLHFLTGFMGILGPFEGLFEGFRGLHSLKWAWLEASKPCLQSLSSLLELFSRSKCKALEYSLTLTSLA